MENGIYYEYLGPQGNEHSYKIHFMRAGVSTVNDFIVNYNNTMENIENYFNERGFRNLVYYS
jgi:hypothetical protein